MNISPETLQKPVADRNARNLKQQKREGPSEKPKGEDLVAKALALHAEYVQLRHDFIAYLFSERLCDVQFLRFWSMQVARAVPRLAGYVNVQKVGRDNNREFGDAKVRRRRYEDKAIALVEVLGKPAFRKQLEAKSEDEQDELWGELVFALGESWVGRKFLVEQIEEASSFVAVNVFKGARKLQSAFWKTMCEIAPFYLVHGRQEGVSKLEAFVAGKHGSKFVVFQGPEAFSKMRAGALARTIRDFNPALQSRLVFHQYSAHDTKALVAKAKPIAEKFFDVLNLALALGTFAEDASKASQSGDGAHTKPLWRDSVTLASAVASLADKFDDTYATVLTDPRWTKKVGPRGTRITGLSAFSGICDTVTGGYDCWTRVTKGDNAAAAAYGAVSAGGALTLLGCTLAYYGTATAVTGWGCWLIAIGAVVGGAGYVAGAFLDPSDLEHWVKNNLYGTEYASHPAYQKWVGNPHEQVAALVDCLWGFALEVNHTLVTITPHALPRRAPHAIRLVCQWEVDHVVVTSNHSEREAQVKMEGDEIESLSWTVHAPGCTDPRAPGKLLSVDATVQITLDDPNSARHRQLTVSHHERETEATLSPRLLQK